MLTGIALFFQLTISSEPDAIMPIARHTLAGLATALTAWIAFTLASPAQATLVAADLVVRGDGLITRDLKTGYEWLDLTTTVGLSYDDIVANVGGWASRGFRVATTSQVETLFGDAGIELPLEFGAYGVPVGQLLSLMGCNRTCDQATGNFASDGLAVNSSSSMQDMLLQLTPDRAYAFASFLFPKDFRGRGMSIYVFRVPEPSTLALLVVTLLMLMLFLSLRRRNTDG